jgi:hypothetical protein
MHFLRQNTATQVQAGPYISLVDGKTELATLLLTATSFFFSKVGGAFAVGTSTATIANSGAWYTVPLASGLVDTVGRFRMYNNASSATNALPVWHDFHVMAATVYDALISATGLLAVNSTQVGGAIPSTATDLQMAVFNAVMANYTVQGSFGQAIGDPGGTNASLQTTITTNLDSKISNVPAAVGAVNVEGAETIITSLRYANAANAGTVTKNVTTGQVQVMSLDGTKVRSDALTSSSGRSVTARDST